MEDLGEVGVLAHPVAAAADVDDMAVMQQAIDERSGHDLVAQDLAPLLEAFIGGQHSGCALIAPVDELEEEHGAGLADRQVADLVDDQERRIGEDLEAASQLAGGLGFFERGDEVGQSAVVDPAPALGRRDRQTDREVRLADAGRAPDTLLTNRRSASGIAGIRWLIRSFESPAAGTVAGRPAMSWRFLTARRRRCRCG